MLEADNDGLNDEHDYLRSAFVCSETSRKSEYSSVFLPQV